MKKTRASLAFALAVSLTGAISVHAGTIALLHANLIDGTGGPAQPDTTILIEGSNISAVGPSRSIAVGPDALRIDLHGKSVLPGLISDHSHLGQTDGDSSGPQNYNRANLVRELKQWQRYGVTTVTSLGLNAPLFYQLQPLAHQGTLGGADFFGADRGIGVPDGAPPMDEAADQLYRPATATEARADVDAMAARHPSLIKVWVDDFHHSVPKKMPPEIYDAVIDEAHRDGLRVAAHVYYLADAKRLVADGADVLAHGVRDEPVDQAFIDLLKQHATWYIATLQLDESFYIYAQQPHWMQSPFFLAGVQPALNQLFHSDTWRAKALAPATLAVNEHSLATNEANLYRLYRAGVKIGFGTDSGATPLRIPGFAEHRELHLMVDAGFTPSQAIQMATSNASRLLQLTDRGVVAKGKRADLLIVDGDPSHDIDAIDHIDSVWEQGQQVAGPLAP
ncbi:amidohydrolase family protein [Frateuria aurantia]